MKTFHYIALALTALLLVTSCAIDEMWSDVEPADEQKVLTFKPKFEDFETVTKVIGDGSMVDMLLVQVYEENGETPVFSKEYSRGDWSKVQIAFYYGKTYKVYFWAYYKGGEAYEISQTGLKGGVTVTYPESDDVLAFDALEHLDAFYAVETINLSDTKPDNTTPSLTRPFAQVNLLAKKSDLRNAKASTVIFELSAASAFVPGPGGDAIGEPVSRTFTFTSNDYFQTISESLDGKVYLGTTYIFVSSQEISGKVTLKDENGKTLKGPSEITIPLAKNSRTNLVFSDIQPAKLPWNDNKFVVPGDDDNDGWIHITCPEELAALLIKPSGDNINVHICDDIDMGDVDAEILNQITGKSFLGLKLDGGIYPDNNMEATPTGNNSIKNLSAAAFIGTATNLTVRNLTVDNLHITNDDGHVGTLVNTLRGTSSFSNVNVSNSSATTSNGAAGGIVGYIERISPKDRSQELEVAFYGCSVNGSQDKPVADGTDAEGKFVGKFSGYDYREKLTFDKYCTAAEYTKVTDFSSRYSEGNEGEWLETNVYTQYDGFLGEETYNRGTIMFGVNQFVPMWDGIKQVPLMDAIQAYDGWSSGKVIYSAFDLASLQGLTSTSGNYYLCADVDLGGDGKDGQVGKLDKDRNMQECGADDALFNPINCIANLNGVKKDMIGTEQASLKESDNYSIYNCKVVLDKHDGIGAGFIKQVKGTTNHNNINLVRAYVYNHHDETIPEQKYYQNDNGSGNAYAGTFVSTVGGTYNISNIHVSYGHVMAVCKIGGIIGRVSGVLNMSNCSVHNHKVENWEANIINWYPMAMPLSDWMVYINQSWYTQGECGGLIGFVKSLSATIDNCSVTDTDINCYGQPDKQVTAGVYMSGWTSIEAAGPNPGGIKGYTIIAGRHVNQFIGDVVSERAESRANSSDYTVTIKDYCVSGNKYFGVPVADATAKTLPEVKSHPAPRTVLYNSSPTSHAYGFTYKERSTGWLIKTYYYTHTVTSFCNCIGSAYYVGVDVDVMGIEKHVRHCAGTLVFNEKGKPAVTVTEAIKDGNNIAWTGGDFWM